MAAQPRISAVVCTYNRAHLLPEALEALKAQTLATSEYEIIVVNNASTDETQRVVSRYEDADAYVRYSFEPQLGLSHARNRGLSEARAPIVAFVDDDARAAPGWLESILNAFETETVRPLCVGGKIEPVWQASRPAWLPDSHLEWLAVLDNGSIPHFCDYPREALFGTNIAFEREFLLEAGGFDTQLGRKGNALLCNEEGELIMKLLFAGGRAFYEPRALVRHVVPAERLTLRWFMRRVFAQGVSNAICDVAGRTSHGRDTRQRTSAAERLRKLVRAHDSQALFRAGVPVVYKLGRRWQLLRSKLGGVPREKTLAAQAGRQRLT